MKEKAKWKGASTSGKVKPSCSNVLSRIFVASSVWRVWESIGGIPNRTLMELLYPKFILPCYYNARSVCPFNICCTYSILTIPEREVLSWFSIGPLRDRDRVVFLTHSHWAKRLQQCKALPLFPASPHASHTPCFCWRVLVPSKQYSTIAESLLLCS